MFKELVDIKEDKLLMFDYELLTILLKDKTTNKNIVWGTDNYISHGYGFNEKDPILSEKITGYYGEIIKPRVRKSKVEQIQRARDKAEVFTPSWICNKQNNLLDEAWFEREHVFNIEVDETWQTIVEPIQFPISKTWQEYICLLRMEVSCGEAPYLVSRYDTVTGKIIDLTNRIGLLDRKFRVLNENVKEKEQWILWAKKAIKSIYGFDWQGDNVLLARENILYTFVDNYKYMFNQKPPVDLIKEVAEIISWNIWQMDGINYIVPYSCKNEKYTEYTIFGEEDYVVECYGCKKGNIHKHNGVYSKIMNWETNRANKFINLVDRSK